MYVAVCSELIAERGCPCPHQAKGQAAPSPPHSSKSSREFKHKPICERLFCSSVTHSSLGIPSQASGVLLASEFTYVSISLTGRLSTVPGRGGSALASPSGEAAFRVSFQYLSYSRGAGGGGTGEL